MGFISSPLLLAGTFSRAQTCMRCYVASPNPLARLSRRQLLSSAAGATTTSLAASLCQPALVKNGTGLERAFSAVLFPKEGLNAPYSLQSSSVTIDKSILGSKEAQNGFKKVGEYEKKVGHFMSNLSKMPKSN